MKRILTIAASDSGGGAGIQADIKTITILGGFAMSAVTVLTAQNTVNVKAIHPVPASFIESQIEAVLEDIGADAVKTGVLLQSDIIKTVAKTLQKHCLSHVVVDPVMKSKAGDTLLEPSAIKALKEELFPVSFIVTPNLDEASVLSGISVDSIEKMKEAAIRIHKMGPKNVLIKGGHLEQDCIDLLYDGQEFSELSSPRINTRNTHGTGCTFSAAVATQIAKGLPVFEAIKSAKDFINTAIRFSLPLGRGHGPTNPFAKVSRDAQIFRCAAELKSAFRKLQQAKIGHLIPEVQSNIGYAITSATSPEDVVAFPGRIIRLGETITNVADPEAGASVHIAKVILTALKYNRRYCSAMNIAWSLAVTERCIALGFRVCEFDRSQEPPDIKQHEGSTLEWGTEKVISRTGEVPDVIFDRGDIGKEPMTRVLGIDPMDVAEKIIKIAKESDQ